MRGTAALVGLILLAVGIPTGTAAQTLAAEGDEELLALAAARGWPGTGTAADPIRIDGLTSPLLIQHVTLDLRIANASLSLGNARSASGIALLNVSRVAIENAQITGGGHGIFIVDAEQALVEGGHVTLARTVAVTLAGGLQHPAAALEIRGTRVTGSAKAIELDHVGPGSLSVRGVDLSGNTAGIDATLFAATPSLTIADSSIVDTFGSAIVSDASKALITRNMIVNAGTAIEQRGQRTGALIEGNVVQESDLGVRLSGAAGVTIHANRFLANRVGASIQNSFAALVYDNLFDNSGTNAEQFNSAVQWNVTKRAGTNILGGAFVAGNAWNDNLPVDRDADGVSENTYQPLRLRPREPALPGGTPPRFDFAPLVYPG